jgi:hypothetical protein
MLRAHKVFHEKSFYNLIWDVQIKDKKCAKIRPCCETCFIFFTPSITPKVSELCKNLDMSQLCKNLDGSTYYIGSRDISKF